MSRKLAFTLFLIAGLNFMAFVIVAVSIGGDAINGKADDGRYYLANHGKYTEVSPGLWRYSKAHAISVFITHPLALGAGAILAFSQRKRTPHCTAGQGTT